jgi:hypothetical protein
MIMKVKKHQSSIWVLALFCSAFLVSCKKDFLDQTPNNAITDENYYQTEADAIKAVNAIYTPAMGLYNGGGWQILDIMTDDTDKGGGGANDGVEVYELDNFTLNSFNPMIATYYGQCYQGIQRSSIVLDKVPGIQGMSENIRKRCLGEAYFLRGYYYFMLVRLFGDVPLYTKPITLPDAYKIARSPKAQVYSTIISDLKQAIDLLPTTRYSGEDAGRVNSWSARAMLASVYLTRNADGDLGSAKDEALAVINSGVYSLNTSYADNFNVLKENGQESLFEVQYRNAGQSWSFFGQGSVLNCFMAPRAQNIVQSSGYGFNVPTQDFVNQYERNAAGNIIDKRRSASIWMPGDKYKNYTQPNSLEGSPLGYNVRKYFVSVDDVNADAGGWSCSGNVPVMRFAEVLLIAAEALGVGPGEFYLNKVRQRAGLPPVSPGMSDAAYRDAIYKERRIELAFEMHRWFDLIRHPEPDYMLKVMNAAGKNAQKRHYLMPIPQAERDKNPNLSQNQGY